MNILCKYFEVLNLVLINYSTLQILQEIDDITQIIYSKYLIKIKTKNQENFSQEVCLILHMYIYPKLYCLQQCNPIGIRRNVSSKREILPKVFAALLELFIQKYLNIVKRTEYNLCKE